MFSKSSFCREIERASLEIILWHQFSYFRPEALALFAHRFGVPADAIRDTGISQFAIVKGRGHPSP
jgi:hypothetical protein